VYMRQEVVGEEELQAMTLRRLGLTSGKCLLRLTSKAPEQAGVQAGVYAMKEREREVQERVHRPMRLEAATLPQEEREEVQVERKEEEGMEVDTEAVASSLEKAVEPQATLTSPTDMASTSLSGTITASSTPIAPTVTPVITPIPDHGAIVFREDEGCALDTDIDDDFFELTIAEVKSRYADLKAEVAKLEEGGELLTSANKEAREEGGKLGLLNKYKAGIVRIRLPGRHLVQGEFPPSTTPSSLLSWLAPLLLAPSPSSYLYTAPPHTRLPPSSSLLDLGLFPAATIHLSSPDGEAQLRPEVAASLSNSSGAQEAAAEARARNTRRHGGGGNIGGAGSSGEPRSRPGKRSGDLQAGQAASSSSAAGGQKLPKWFKTGK